MIEGGGIRREAVRWDMACRENGVAHSDMTGKISVTLGELDRSNKDSDWRDGQKDQISGARDVVAFHAAQCRASKRPAPRNFSVLLACGKRDLSRNNLVNTRVYFFSCTLGQLHIG